MVFAYGLLHDLGRDTGKEPRMNRIRVIVPVVKPVHVKHTAAGLTIGGGLAEAFAPFHLGAILFVLAGCIAIYEPYFVTIHEINHPEL